MLNATVMLKSEADKKYTQYMSYRLNLLQLSIIDESIESCHEKMIQYIEDKHWEDVGKNHGNMPVIFKFSNTSDYILCVIGEKVLGPEQYIQKMGISKALCEGISLNYKNFSDEEKLKADIVLKSHNQNGCVTCLVNNENVKIFNNGELSNPSIQIAIKIDDAVISYSFQNYLTGTNLFKTHFNVLESENIPLIAGGLYHDIKKELPNCKFISSLSDALDYGRRVRFKNRLEQLNCESQNIIKRLQEINCQIENLYNEFDKISNIN